MKYEVGTHRTHRVFKEFSEAIKYYNELSGLKYLAELDIKNRPSRIIKNTYGWRNE